MLWKNKHSAPSVTHYSAVVRVRRTTTTTQQQRIQESHRGKQQPSGMMADANDILLGSHPTTITAKTTTTPKLPQMIFFERKNLLKYSICQPPTPIISITLKRQKPMTREAVESLVCRILSSRALM
mmetsp:Transcript_13019/g.23203  ORF Transcript_13019/g.23203 Transcript_13019/m.23203 type:complete len:126 (-) Transcript_13019:560-937(-)